MDLLISFVLPFITNIKGNQINMITGIKMTNKLMNYVGNQKFRKEKEIMFLL
jgi:hypothetical protein